MFSVILTFTAAIILVVGIVLNQNRVPDDLLNELENTQVLSQESQNDEQQEDEGGQSKRSDTETDGENSSPVAVNNSEQAETKTDPANNVRLDQFAYSNSSIVSSTDDQLILESFDDPDQITDWYKQRLESRDMNINSFVTTNTNGNINNELVSSDGTVEIRVKIAKSAEEDKASIEVNIL